MRRSCHVKSSGVSPSYELKIDKRKKGKVKFFCVLLHKQCKCCWCLNQSIVEIHVDKKGSVITVLGLGYGKEKINQILLLDIIWYIIIRIYIWLRMIEVNHSRSVGTVFGKLVAADHGVYYHRQQNSVLLLKHWCFIYKYIYFKLELISPELFN